MKIMLFIFSWEMENYKKDKYGAMMYAAHNKVDNIIATMTLMVNKLMGLLMKLIPTKS